MEQVCAAAAAAARAGWERRENRSGLINTELLSGGLNLLCRNEPAQLKGINKVGNYQA